MISLNVFLVLEINIVMRHLCMLLKHNLPDKTSFIAKPSILFQTLIIADSWTGCMQVAKASTKHVPWLLVNESTYISKQCSDSYLKLKPFCFLVASNRAIFWWCNIFQSKIIKSIIINRLIQNKKQRSYANVILKWASCQYVLWVSFLSFIWLFVSRRLAYLNF